VVQISHKSRNFVLTTSRTTVANPTSIR